MRIRDVVIKRINKHIRRLGRSRDSAYVAGDDLTEHVIQAKINFWQSILSKLGGCDERTNRS